MKNTNTVDLVKRLNAIRAEKQQLETRIITLDDEYNNVVQELWDRIPSLQNDEQMQKIKTKGKS